jgi:PAS domain S-box-containing protein/diguanylate cyclase (GGDEF)-like protein
MKARADVAKILVVDDRASNREYLTTLLGYSGHTLIEANDGASALQAVRSQKPDLVITDILMPTMDGFEFVQMLRNDAKLASTRVIFHTATYSEPQALALAKSCGVEIVLPKPSEPRQVLDAVSQMLGVKKAHARAEADQPQKQNASAARRVDDTLNLYLSDIRRAGGSLDELGAEKAKTLVRERQAKAFSDKFSENVARLQRIMSRLSSLIEVGMEMDRERDPGRLVDIFFGAACEIVDAQVAALAILDEKQDVPSHLLTKGISAQLFASKGSSRIGLLGSLLDQRGALRQGRIDSALAADALPVGHPPVRDFLGVSISTDSRAYGWIYFANKGDGSDFNAEDERLVSIMGAKLALLYENLQLYDLVQTHAASLQIEMARREGAETAVRAAEARYRSVFENSVIGVFVVDPQGRVVSSNPALARMLGYESAEEMAGGITSVGRQVYVERGERPRFQELLRSQGIVEAFETKWRRRDGSIIWVSLSARRIDDETIGHIGTVEDITQRKRSEEDLRQSEARKAAIVESSLDCLVTIDHQGRIIEFNPAAEATFGYSRQQVLGESMVELIIPPHLRDSHRAGFARYLATGEARILGKRLELQAIRADGTEFPVELAISVIRSGPMPLFTAFIRDITLRKRGEEELRRFRLAMDNSADIILIIDRAAMRYVDVNETACKLLGYSREELLARGPEDMVEVSRAELEKDYDALIADPSRTGGMVGAYRCKDGSRLPFESTRHVLRSSDTWLIAAISRDIRGRIAAEQSMRESEERFRQTFELAGSGISHVGLDRRFLRVNRKLCEMFGYTEAELIGRSARDLSHPDDKDVTDARFEAVRAGKTEASSFEKRYLRKDGSVIWVNLTIATVRDASGAPQYSISVLDDITERKATQAKVERLTRVHAVLSGINGAIVRIRDRQELFDEACRVAAQAGRFPMVWLGMVDREEMRINPVAWNERAEKFLTIAKPRFSLAGDSFGPGGLAVIERRPFVSNDIEHDPRLKLKKEHADLDIRSMAVLPLLRSGEAIGVLALHASEVGFFDDEEMKLLVELAGDIAFALDHIEKEEKIQYLAYYDSLTGLTNRTLFLERLAQRTSTARDERRKFGLSILNVERFKAVNDSLGRQAGDELLKQIAERLLKLTGEPKYVARVGADQFAVLMPDVRDEQRLARSVEEQRERIGAEPYRLGDTEVRISARGGVAVYPTDATDAETLFRNAEAALTKAKANREPYLFYAQEMTARVAEKLTLENRLRQALEKDEFVLYYQPKVELDKRTVVGVEALIRWRSPELGLVPPLNFIPLLEETGLIMPVGAWALKRAAADHRKWVELGFKNLRVAVNVSPIQLRQRDFVQSIEQAIIDGVAPTGIDLEITESVVMEDIKANIEKLAAVRALGVKTAIDDFGTGYSSLGYLARLPVQCLKIDRSFVIAMDKDPNASTLVQTIISLAHSLGLEVVAEGVETEDQAKLLRLLRCDQMQGYLFSKPVPFNDLIALLQKAG